MDTYVSMIYKGDCFAELGGIGGWRTMGACWGREEIMITL